MLFNFQVVGGSPNSSVVNLSFNFFIVREEKLQDFNFGDVLIFALWPDGQSVLRGVP